MGRPQPMDSLALSAWRLYQQTEGARCVVRPSIPILFFGDSDRYMNSPMRVITVGLNPSFAEFPTTDPFQRFPSARDVFPRIISGDGSQAYVRSLNDYFRASPYSSWFSSFEPMLNGMDASYYDGAENVALHTDLCSPLATNPTWSRLSREARAELLPDGRSLWHELVRFLVPDVILLSVAAVNLETILLARRGGWETIHTVVRRKPFEVRAVEVEIASGKGSLLVFGRAAQKPFGTISANDKRSVGASIRERLRA